MDNNGTILFWAAPRPTTADETLVITTVTNAFASVGILQLTPLVPTLTTLPSTEVPTENPSCGESITHVVQVGENLFRIALRYGTTIDAISRANSISDPNQIIVGQTLAIPCGTDNGTSSVAPQDLNTQTTLAPDTSDATPTPIASTNQTVDCSAFNSSFPSNVPPAFQQLFNQFCQQ
jgi:LysM repeat protein